MEATRLRWECRELVVLGSEDKQRLPRGLKKRGSKLEFELHEAVAGCENVWLKMQAQPVAG